MTTDFERHDISPKIHWLDFKEQAVLGETFCRFQEFYEGPKHAGTNFTLEEYAEWYKTQSKTGEFTYYTDWYGFNFPSRVLEQFRGPHRKFEPSARESELLLSLIDVDSEAYIIGTFQGDITTLKHEVAHALFTTEPNYVTAVLRVLGTVELTPIFETIEKHGYAGVTWVDEAHAYLLECPWKLREWGLDINPYKKVINQLQTIYDSWTPAEDTRFLDPWTKSDKRLDQKQLQV